jgi:hypothetical protein
MTVAVDVFGDSTGIFQRRHEVSPWSTICIVRLGMLDDTDLPIVWVKLAILRHILDVLLV